MWHFYVFNKTYSLKLKISALKGIYNFKEGPDLYLLIPKKIQKKIVTVYLLQVKLEPLLE